MLKYELKKLLFKPTILVLLLLSFFGFAWKTYRLISSYTIFTEDGNVRGTEAIREDKKHYKERFQGLLTDEKVKNDLTDLRKDIRFNPEEAPQKATENLYSSLLFYRFASYYFWISDVYEKDWYDLFADVGGLGDFYTTRRDLLFHLTEQSNWTPKTKTYVSKMINKTEMPFVYGYHTGWKYFETFLNNAIYFLIAVGVAVLGVFSDEDKTGMYSVLLSAKNGRDRLLKTKLKAVFLVFLFASLMIVGGAICANAVSFGFDGYDLPIQIRTMTDFLPINFLQQGTLNAILKLFNILFVIVYATFLSSYVKKKEYGVICLLLPFIVRYVMRINGADVFAVFGADLLKYVQLLPIFSLTPESTYLYEFLGLPLNYYQAVILLQSLVILFLTVLTVRKVKKDYAM